MKKKGLMLQKWKRGISLAVSCVMAVTMLPVFSASAKETELIKAGSLGVTEDTVTLGQPFPTGTADSYNFRIPALISVENGEHRGNLIAAADARYATPGDGGGLDTIASVSTDMGQTWNYSFPIWFPDSEGYATRNATTVIDPALVEGPDGTIYCLADVNPTGITTQYGSVPNGRGYIKVNGVNRIALTDNYANAGTDPTSNETIYAYYVGDFVNGYAPVLRRSDNGATDWRVDEWYNIEKKINGTFEPLTQKQVNTDRDVQQNVFYRDSELHVFNIGYVWIVESRDGGCTWVNPRIVNDQVKRETGDGAILVSPGKGLTTSDGVITVPFYSTGQGERASFIYSRDGINWKRTNDVVPTGSANKSSESEMVELSDGTLRMFFRSGRNSNNICYADAVRNASGDYTMGAMVETGVPAWGDCNVTAIRYSRKSNGRDLILVACPSKGNPARSYGKVYSFEVNEDKTMTLLGTVDIEDPEYNNGYAYSCLTEQQDGTVGLLYEPNTGGHIGKAPHRMLYESYHILELAPSAVIDDTIIDVELSAEKAVYTRSYEKAGEPVISQQPDPAVASVTAEKDGQAAPVLYSHTGTDNVFSASPDKSLTLQDCEFTITSGTGTNIYTIYNASKKLYLNNTWATNYFSAESKGMKIEKVQGEEGFVILPNDGSTRRIFFFRTKNIFDAAGSFNASYDANWNFTLLKKKGTVSESDLVPGYEKADSITSGDTYLITCVEGDKVYIMYPDNNSYTRTRLYKGEIEQGTGSRTKVTVTKGNTMGMTMAVIDGVTYRIEVTDGAEKIQIEQGQSYVVDGGNASHAGGDTDAVRTEERVKYFLCDHVSDTNDTDSAFGREANPVMDLENAEMTFVQTEGDKYRIKNEFIDHYVANTSHIFYFDPIPADMTVSTVSTGQGNVFRIRNSQNSYLCYNYASSIFDRSSYLDSWTGGTYDFVLFEKKDTASDSDLIPGYQRANSIVSGKNYLITCVRDNYVIILYPGAVDQASWDNVNNLTTQAKNSRTKLFRKQPVTQTVVTGTASGKSVRLQIDGKLYAFEIHEAVSKSAAASSFQAVLEMVAALAEKGKEEYTETSWSVLMQAYEKAADAQGDLSVPELKSLTRELTEAKENLKVTDKELEAAKEQAKSLLTDVSTDYQAGQKNYTDQSWKAFKEAYEDLQKALESESKEELAAMEAKLREARKNLEPVKTDKDGRDDLTTDPGRNENQGNPAVTEAPSVKSVKASAGKKGISVKVTVQTVKGADHYAVYRVSGTKRVLVGKTKSGRTTVTDQKVTGRKVSYYAVACAADGREISGRGAEKAVTLEAPVKLQKPARTEKGIRISWKKSKKAVKYVIYRSEKKNSGYVRVAVVSKKTLSYLDKKVKKGKTCYYKVAVKTRKGVSLMSKAGRAKY